jgi:hypothetical protein
MNSLGPLMLQMIVAKLITPEEADRIQEVLNYAPVPPTWRAVVEEFECVIGRTLDVPK